MFTRQKIEVEFVPLYESSKMGTTIWAPLAGGMLTGKYNDSIPQDSRVETWGDANIAKMFFLDPFMGGDKKEKTVSILKALGEVASSLGANLAQLALAWTIYNKDVSTALIGASRVSQVEDNIKALALSKKLTPEVLEKIETILGNRPSTGMNWKTFGPATARR
jgi:aryl-alcohol dehydrogenase-like predicted oxidoreductase